MTHPRAIPSSTPESSDTDLLVIGYGNPLRRDDGAGPRVAEIIEQLRLPNVRTLTCHQLAPEHAAPVFRARRVVFVDAAVNHTDTDRADGVQLRKLEPGATTQLLAHAADPRTLLALARDVFGRAPEAWWLTIPARHLGFGTDYSPATESGIRAAVSEVRRLAVPAVPVASTGHPDCM